MKQIYFILLCAFLPISVFAQIVKEGDVFTEVTEVEGKVIFIKEINLSEEVDVAYPKLKEWGRENYGKDPFISSIRYDDRNKEIIAKSRVELLLPPNTKNVREKVVMRYRLNAFLFQDKCVLEVKEISYMLDSSKKTASKKNVLRAEDMILESAIEAEESLKELKENTRKSTIYFLNELVKGLEKAVE